MHAIEAQPSQIEAVGAPEKNPIESQAVVIRTMGSPELLTRVLSAIRAGVRDTQSRSTISVGIMDDSRDPATIRANKAILAEVGMQGHYLNTTETESGSLLTRIRERAMEKAVEHGLPASELVTAYHYLLTEQADLDRPTFLPDMQVGKGSNATSNVATLLGAYMLGTEVIAQTKGIITHYDNDVIPGRTLTEENGTYTFASFDAFDERDELFAEPERLLTGGKYSGVAGDPFGTAVIALQITEGILSDFHTKDLSVKSSYTLYDASSESFTELTVGEAFDNLPKIIKSFLVRAPITGFLTQEFLSQFTPATFKHDGGNVSIRDSFARIVPASPTGVHEYAIVAPLKALNRDIDTDKLIGLETPALHIRADLPPDVDIHAGGLLSGTSGRIVRHQVLLETALAQRPELAGEIFNAYTHQPASADILNTLPKLNTDENPNKKERLNGVRQLRDRIQRLANTVTAETAITEAVESLLVEFDDEALNAIEEVLDPSQQSKSDVHKMSVGLEKYFIPSLKYWPMLYDAAYEIGLEDAA